MSIYLGTFGKVELKRKSGGALLGKIRAKEINTNARRFSFDFDIDQLITGDKVTITDITGVAVDFISGNTDPSITKFINVDEAGGIRLYDTFAHAVNGGFANALPLVECSDLDVKVTVDNNRRLLAQVSSYEINTERESVDTTVLSDNFRQRVSSLISGSGRFSAFWEYALDDEKELPNYLLQLILRTKVGSDFAARLYIKDNNYNPSGAPVRNNDKLYYKVRGIITAAAVQFTPDSVVQITADFITTGPVELRVDLSAPFALTQEDGSKLLEDDESAEIGIDGAGES
tara:strand:- start:1475 stop:2338 length:864 start_codon:yes stop_codon:yes gene_type:complete